MKYSGSGQGEKAYSLHQYNVEHFPDHNGLDVIWSQSELIRLDLQAGRYESACAGADKLLGWPPDQNDLPREIHVTAKRFAEAGKRDKAYELYLHNVDHFPTDMYAMWSQVEIAYANISGGDFAAADAACDKLLSLFSDQQSLPKEVYQVAGAYNKAKRSDKSAELCRYVVEKWPKSDHALWAQRDLAMWSIDADDEFAAQAAVDKLLSDFSEHQRIAQVIHSVAQHYERAKGNLEKALELHRYNAEHFSSDVYAMWSQVEIVYFHIRDGNDAAADNAFDKLLTAFADQPTLPKEIYQVGDQYAKARNFDKAGALYQRVIANCPGTEYEMWARTGNVRIDILAGNQTAVEPAVDALIADFNDHPGLPAAVFRIGEGCYEPAFAAENKGDLSQSKDLFRKAIAIWERIVTELPESPITPQAYYFSARCYETLGELDYAANYYQTVIDDWPDYKFCDVAHFLLARCFEKLANSGSIPKEEAALMIRATCEKLLAGYPDSQIVKATTNLLEQWKSVKAQ
jgi:tetratricopeptide (TPR) repeat protein